MDREAFRGPGTWNSVKERLVAAWDELRYCFTYLARQKATEAKALDCSRDRRHD
jgi:hypothetical protein